MPIRFTPSVISNGIGLAGPSRPIVRSAQPTPAQLTQKRSSPSASTAPSTAAFTLSSSWTSVSKNGSPVSSGGGLRSATATFAPRAFNASTVAAPSPEEPPTTSAPRPSIFMRRDSTKRCTFPLDGGFVRPWGGAAHLHAPGLFPRPAALCASDRGRPHPWSLRPVHRVDARRLEAGLHRAADRGGDRRLHRRLGAPV